MWVLHFSQIEYGRVVGSLIGEKRAIAYIRVVGYTPG
jgi:hypothetical protein